MAWCKTHFLPKLMRPMDNGRVCRDKERLFGDNKTWKGFWGMIVFAMVSNLLWGLLCGANPFLQAHHYLYMNHGNTPAFNLFTGFLIGLAYAVFELPNSFLKRRFRIVPGKTSKGWKAVLFVILDQADSIFGCVLVIAISIRCRAVLFPVRCSRAATHIVINALLYAMKLRKNVF
jgi:CDP-diglyceride synthetase